ncbi:hypothetical protein CTEN210_17252 [Chaetoceros tenuissimus]|uniref:PDZ domain-containing protein n=1 Tax=Chaetoceros tenuissimus TaxID=426638 RepID=A0AAD3DAC4_9STRA|nr:hypothetical protein CTEN210_17252 [Chaetoceros tenuissimus]
MTNFKIAAASILLAGSFSTEAFAPSTIRSPTQTNNLRKIQLHACNQDNNDLVESFKAIARKSQKFVAASVLASALFFQSTPVSAADYNSMTDEQKAVAEAWRIVDNNFIDRTFNKQDWFKIRQDAVKTKYKSMNEAQNEIEKIVGSLGDKYTRYLPPAKYRSIVDSATGTLAGVGVEISTDSKGNVIVADTEPSSPASNAGIKKNDIFIEVDGEKFNDGKSTPDDVAARLRGPEGSKVGVVVERDGKIQDFIITRQPITITSVRSYMSDKGGVGKVGVVRIKSFSGTTAQTVSDALDELKKKGAEAFVLDVRGNPGGLLPGGVDTASLFLPADKPLVFVVDKKGTQDNQATYKDGSYLDTPLVILVNGNTASAAEVMTAALKENGRAVVVGEQTFGKGIIQTIRQLGYDNGGVAVTVARYETPLHNNINKAGIPVDIESKDCDNDDAVVCVPSSALKK